MEWDPGERDLRMELARIAIRVHQRGLAAGTGGNVSVRLPGRDQVLITATGLSLEMTTPNNLAKTNLRAEPLSPSARYLPSKETGFHCAVYRVRPEVGAIVHAHPPYATAFALRNQELPLVTISASVTLKHVPCIDVALSGSSALRDMVEEAFLGHPGVQAILMRAHGIIAVGPDLMSAYNVADLLEETAKIAYLSAELGVPLEESVEVAFRPLM